MEINYHEIIKRVEEVRHQARLNKSAFSARLGMKPQTYNNFIGKQGSKASVALVAGVCQAFDADANWLLLGVASSSLLSRARQKSEAAIKLAGKALALGRSARDDLDQTEQAHAEAAALSEMG